MHIWQTTLAEQEAFGVLKLKPYEAELIQRTRAKQNCDLRAESVQFFSQQSSYPIYVTIQPNLGGRSHSGIQSLKALVRNIFYELDRHYTGCPKPEFLAPEERFNGFVFLEDDRTNPHVHIVLSNHWHDQHLRYMFLLWFLDNVPLEKCRTSTPTDIENELTAWMTLEEHLLKGRDLNNCASFSILTKSATKGTAKVQLVQSASGLVQAIKYNTKFWMSAMRIADNSRRAFVDDMDLNYWELRDDFSPLGTTNPARCWTLDPANTGRRIYDPGKWRIRGGKHLRR